MLFPNHCHFVTNLMNSLMTNAHSKTEQMAVCCQNLMLGVLSSCSMLSVLVGMLFKKVGLFLNRDVLAVP
jgi:hypothetical protein